jgi:hypothetical protein
LEFEDDQSILKGHEIDKLIWVGEEGRQYEIETLCDEIWGEVAGLIMSSNRDWAILYARRMLFDRSEWYTEPMNTMREKYKFIDMAVMQLSFPLLLITEEYIGEKLGEMFP